MSSAVRGVGAAWRRRRASRARFDAANARAIRDPGSCRAARRFSREKFAPGTPRSSRGFIVPSLRTAPRSPYFGGCCFLEEKRRGGVSQRADTRDARGDDGDGDLSRTRSRGVARAGERAGRASRRFDRSPATRPPPCRHAPHIRRTKPQQRRSPRQPRPRGRRRTRRRRRRREARAPRGVHRRGLRARAHTQDRPGRLRARALGPGRLPPARPPLPPAAIPTLGVYAFFLADPPRILASRRPPARAVGCAHAAGTRRGG